MVLVYHVRPIPMQLFHHNKFLSFLQVYWSNGAQIISPHDKDIAKSILANLEPWPASWDLDVADTSALKMDPYDEVMVNYFTDMKYLSKLWSVRGYFNAP